MKKRIAVAIVRFRIWILICIFLIAAWSVFQIGRTNINYDLTRYLSDDTMTKKALAVMQKEFGTTEQLRLLFENQDETALKGIMDRLREMPEILAVQHDPETDRKQQDGIEWQLVTITLNDCDAAALVTTLRGMFPEAGHYSVGGAAAQQLDVQRSVGAEIPGIMIIAVAVVFGVLLLTLGDRWVVSAAKIKSE